MGQKINPVGLRLGIIRGWDSSWYGEKDFSEKLIEDSQIRKYVLNRIPKASISKIVIERTLKRITLTIFTSRPGVVIGKNGAEVDKIKEELKKIYTKDIQINIAEIKRPEIDAKLVGEVIAQQLEARISFRRAMKQAIASAMKSGALGIKLKVSGRLGGAEMARSEGYKEGRIPLHTLRADIDYAVSEAHTVYGIIGIKVWIFKGEVFGKRELSPVANLNTGSNERGAGAGNAGGRFERGEGGGDRRGGRRSDDRDKDSRGGGNNSGNAGGRRGKKK